MSTEHANLLSKVRITLGQKARHTRLFINVRGFFWQGKVLRQDADTVTLFRPRRVVVGLAPGGLDLIGWTTITVTPDMVGQKIAVFTAGDIKVGRDVLSDEQITFRDNVLEAGGRAGEIRSEEQALALVAL